MSGEQSATATERTGWIDRLAETGWLTTIGFAIGVVLFPWFLVDGLEIVAELINISVGGYTSLAPLVLIYGIVVVGFNILLGYTGLLSFGHAAFFGTAAYTAGLFSWMIGDPILMILAGAIGATLIAWPIGWVSIRRSGVYFAVITLTFGQMLYFWALGPGGWLTNGDDGFSSFQTEPILGAFELDAPILEGIGFLEMYTWEYAFVGVFAIVAIWTAKRIIDSPYGLIFEALGQNQRRVSFVGLNVSRYKLMAFIISAAFAGVGGSLWAMHESYVHPGTAYYWIQSGDFVIMTILGGAGSVVGPVFGAFIFEYVSNVISGVSLPVIGAIGSLWRIVLGAVFVVIVWWFPRGIYPPIRDGFGRLGSFVRNRGGGEE
ncbi:MAG: branched-chain amino acid ABC transporter permease [Haloarculaceae archaeon]